MLIKMIKSLVCLFCFLLSFHTFAQTFNLGRFSIGESRVQIDLFDFLIHTNNKNVSAVWVPDSVQWIRNENNLLVPRALLKISVNLTECVFHYQNKTIIPTRTGSGVSSAQYIDLFNPEILSVYCGSQIQDKIVIEARAAQYARSKQLIDYSCSPYELKIDGVDNEYLSVGCKMNRLGHWGSESPGLEITMSFTNLRTQNGASPPYTLFLQDNSPVELKMKGANGEIKTLHVEALVPEKLYRLKTSLGFGPYIYKSKQDTAVQNANVAPSFMIYGKYDLSDTASLKAFDALLYSKTFFNNSGLYFSYDLASAFDERVLINALLGFQGLHYRYTSQNKTVFRLIYPQGFEVIYKHAFIENYNFTYGMFLSTNNESYTNAWLRYGKKTFLELNYIKWGHELSEIKMWGLSIGIPFFSLF
jgi:hypothetical protein